MRGLTGTQTHRDNRQRPARGPQGSDQLEALGRAEFGRTRFILGTVVCPGRARHPRAIVHRTGRRRPRRDLMAQAGHDTVGLRRAQSCPSRRNRRNDNCDGNLRPDDSTNSAQVPNLQQQLVWGGSRLQSNQIVLSRRLASGPFQLLLRVQSTAARSRVASVCVRVGPLKLFPLPGLMAVGLIR